MIDERIFLQTSFNMQWQKKGSLQSYIKFNENQNRNDLNSLDCSRDWS